MRYYSFAGEAKGKTDPDDIHVTNVTGGDCGVEGCMKDNCEHLVIMWSGGEYSKDDSWISATEKHVIDLEDAR